MSKRVLILSAGAGSGHNVAAAALQSALQSRAEVAELLFIDVLEYTNKVYKDLYAERYYDLVRAMPWVVGWGYDYMDRPFLNLTALNSVEELMLSRVIQIIRAFGADIVICTHFLPARMMSLLIARDSSSATLSTVATDYDFQALWFSTPFNRFFVARDETRAYMISIGLPADRITVAGIPVRPEFGVPQARRDVHARLGLTAELPTLLISAGAAGGTYVPEIIRQTFAIGHPFQAIVVCGRNEALKHQVAALVQGQTYPYIVLGSTTEMAALMQAADIFIGKPGGLTSAECAALGLPMILVNPIPGQEVRNSDYLLEEGAALRCNYHTTVGYKIDLLLADPARRQRMAENARRIGRPQAAQIICDTVLRDDPRHFWISAGAQKALRKRAAAGVAVAEDRAPLGVLQSELVPLRDDITGMSVGLLTVKELDALRQTMGSRVQQQAMQVDEEFVVRLARRRAGSDVVSFFRQLLGDMTSAVLRWSDSN